MAIQFPNLKLRKVLEGILELIATQHTNAVAASLESESWLYRCFYGTVEQKYDFYEQAKNILVTRTETDPKQLKVRINFDPSIAATPSICINTPSETQSGVNGVGMGSDTFEFYENDDTSISDILSRSFEGTYEFVVTSESQLEVELLYRLLFSIFIAFNDTWSSLFEGDFSFSGKSLMVNRELMPHPYYYKMVTITLKDKIEVPTFNSVSYGNDATFTGTAKNEE